MKDQTYWRQLDILSPEAIKSKYITLIGCGGIGSTTAIVLGKIGTTNLSLYDIDEIEQHNVSNQFFSKEQIGLKKVDALSENVKRFSDHINITGNNSLFEIYSRCTEITISGVDSMKSRKEIWKAIKLNMLNVKLYIDARMGAEVYTIIAIDPSNAAQVEEYEKNYMYDDKETEEEKCTAKAIAYNTFAISGYIGALVTRYINKQEYPNIIKGDLHKFLTTIESWK